MRKIDDPSTIKQWGYLDARTGKGFSGSRDHIIVQVQELYLKNRIDFHEKEIPALIDNYMCEQGFAPNCSDRIEGLGDLVHLAIKKLGIDQAVDSAFGTHYAMEGCAGCSARQQVLNHAVPL